MIKIDYKHGFRTKPNIFQKLLWLIPYSFHHRAKLNFIKHILPKVESAVDIGSSEGKFLYLLKLKGIKDVQGIEPNIYYTKFCENHYSIPVIKKCVEDVPRIEVDLVTAIAVLEHLEDPGALIKKIKAKYLFMVFPIEDPLTKPGHILYITFRQAMDMFYKYGWKPIKIDLYWHDKAKTLDLFILLKAKNLPRIQGIG